MFLHRTSISRWISPATFLAAGLALGAPAWAQRSGEPGRPKGDQPAPTSRPAVRDGELRVIPLQHAPAARLAQTLQSALGALMEVRVLSDERSNSLVIIAENPACFERATALIQALDRDNAEQSQHLAGDVQCVPLTHCDAEVVRAQLETLLKVNRGLAMNAVADSASNCLWLSGPKSETEICVSVAKRMDEQANAHKSEDRELKFYLVKEADAGALAGTVARVIKMLELDADIVADTQSNMLIAAGSTEAQQCLAQIISTLDLAPRRPAGPPPQIPPNGQR